MKITEPSYTHGFFLQNLMDAGCDSDRIQQCILLEQQHKTAELLHVLALQRKALLDNLHLGQKQIDCLDYLVYQLKRKAARHSRE